MSNATSERASTFRAEPSWRPGTTRSAPSTRLSLRGFLGRRGSSGARTRLIPGEDVGDLANRYPVEFLNTIEAGQLPPHRLRLKPGCPLILLRNMDQRNGLCNGTRLMCISASTRLIRARVMTGTNVGDVVYLPRATLTSSETELPFVFRRRQFPVRLAFAMTINKSQGQSLECVGVH